MDNETGIIYIRNSALRVSHFEKIKKAFYKVLRCLILGIGIGIIGVIAVPTVILVMIIMGLWSLIDHLISRVEQK